MKIGFHIGAHETDGDRLVKSLLRNRDTLDHAGVFVPGPGRYRGTLRDAAVRMRGDVADADTEESLLDAILDGATPDTLFLSNSSFISVPEMAVGENQLYPRMFKAAWLRNLFPSHSVTFHICVRDPATFLPSIYQTVARDKSFVEFTGGIDPRRLVWSAPINQLLQSVPDADVVLWCYEDTPLIWDEIMRAVCDIGPDVHLHGIYDMARQVMNDEGMPRLRNYVAQHPPANSAMRQRIITAFLDKFGVDAALEQQIPIEGWSQALMDDLTTIYEEDLVDIAELARVRIVTR
ncbi:hypothetical protein ILP92_08810 [Maribius pontilimi]|uniref:Sulfotransferase family protein n=1 Tax=Palleronia pontilimi TaxID=1964209 RepID=A0A934IHU9_9RHOB|nr:hypothetical protein [Palleronia pontilimi]MBJ3762845.1 hypothetical protein [Palleronia pontilimi]